MDDLRKQEEEDKRATQSYVGGERSGLAVQNPGEPDDRFAAMQANASASAGQGPFPADGVTVNVYRDGFTLNDGPFRSSSDPLNKKFLDDMARGTSPAELQAGKTEPVHVAVNDKRGEDYKPPPAAKPAFDAFTGAGNSMGGSSSASAAVAVSASAGSITVDPSKPKTKIRIRFHDGQNVTQELNEDHTVGELRAFCQQCSGGQAMTIMGGFPPKPLEDDSMTIKVAGLGGSQVNVRPKA